MANIATRALFGACALLGASSVTTLAHAQAVGSTATINGGGSSLLAPYWMQIAKCYDSVNTSYYLPGTPVTTKTPASACASSSNNGLYGIGFDATGSGAGQVGFFAHDAIISSTISGTVTTQFGTLNASGAKVFPSLQYGLSDNSLVDKDVGVYTVGTNATYMPPHGRPAVTTDASYQGRTFGTGGDYPLAKPLYGPLVQIPVSVDPVAIAFNPTGLHIATTDGKLHLDPTAYCSIFSHQITDWNDSSLATLNNGVSLTGGASLPIKLVGRSDSSGTTSIFTRHLGAVCGAGNPFLPAGQPPAGTTKLPPSLTSFYTLASGSSGVANAINSQNGAIGYVGSDYVAPYNTQTGTNTFNLPSAALKNSSGNFVAATYDKALNAFNNIKPPQSSATGAYAAVTTTYGYRDDPTAWVQSTSTSAPIANPSDPNAYPIVGTTNFLGYTCYANLAQLNLVKNFLTQAYSTTGNTVLNNAGLGALPAAWKTAISNTFLTSSATDGSAALNLYFARGGSGPTCGSVTGG